MNKPTTCTTPPDGFACSRPAGHTGPCAATPLPGHSARLRILAAAVALTHEAQAAGLVLTIETRPQEPLAMGNYLMALDVRSRRDSALQVAAIGQEVRAEPLAYCCEKGLATPGRCCPECAEISAGYQAAMFSPQAATSAAGGATPATGSWIAADDVNRLVRDLDVAFNGEAGAAPQASLCDVVGQITMEAANAGRPLLDVLRAALAAQSPDSGAGPTHVHRKSGGRYTLIGEGKLQSDKPLPDMAEIAIYRGEDGRLWARDATEFAGRFDSAALAQQGAQSPDSGAGPDLLALRGANETCPRCGNTGSHWCPQGKQGAQNG